MVSANSIVIVLSILGISTVNIHAQDISSFLSQMMKEYMPKNTRQYTLVNGVPVDKEGSGSENEMLSRFSDNPTFGPLVKAVLSTSGPESASFLNSGPWTPSAPSFFSSMFGRSDPEPTRYAMPKYDDEVKIITAEDIQQRSDEPQEFKIESSMVFHP